MRALRLLLRACSYLVNIAVALAALAMSAVILQAPDHAVRIGWLPWKDDVLGAWLAGLGVAGVAVVLLALAGRLRWLLVGFALWVLFLMARGLFFGPWQFANAAEFKQALWIVLGLLISVLGAIPVKRASRESHNPALTRANKRRK